MSKLLLSKFTGKPDPDQYISHSGLAGIKRVLCSEPPFLGDEIYLRFGGEVHSRFLENKKTQEFDKAMELQLKNMIDSLNKHLFVRKLMNGSSFEQSLIEQVYGVNLRVIIDIYNPVKGYAADLKTTSCRNEQQFIKSAIQKYDYIRQGWCYKQVGNIPDFYFIGIQKHPPYQVFILNQSNYEREEKKSEKEAKFLIDFYKEFGRPMLES